MGSTGRRSKNFRLSEETLEKLREIAEILNVSETEAVSRAIVHYYLSLKGEESGALSGIIPLSEYQRLQEKFERAVYKVGELEGRLKEKEEIIRELKERIKELQAKPSRRWWEFWK